ncbi:MAG TPA: 4Fe-4S binding protein [Anaerolineae bacterium]|nr:4Fe-4S binding protein [Anaerolineae bacterium]HPL28382.1 4Fe-4S binding protein [Anaerolineae bacterium]
MAAKGWTVVLDARWCKACGICIELCPQHVFAAEPLTGIVRLEHPEACSGCRQCELLCPDFVMTVEEERNA